MNASSALRTFLDILADPSAGIDAALVDTLAAEAPYFSLPAAVRLRRTPGLDAAERRRLAVRVALTTSSATALTALTDTDGDLLAGFYPPDLTPTRPDTADAITTFLETYGHGADSSDDALLERLIFNPQPDYASVLEEEYADTPDLAADTPDPDGHTAMIDAFLAKRPTLVPEPAAPAPEPAAPVTPQPAATAAPESSLSESLAKIYIRQRRYDKAYEIISNLNLNFPEKSAYFADQLRFLQKLMLNNRHVSAQKATDANK